MYMKILLVEQLGKTNRDYIYSSAKYMCENNDVTCYMSDNTPKDDKKYPFKIVYGFKGAYEGNAVNKAVNYVKALFELKKYIKKNHFDIIHFEWFSLPWIEWIYIRYIKKYSKIVITVNDVIPFEKRPLEMQSLEKIYQKADCILVHTNDCLKLFNKTFHAECFKSVITPAFRDKSEYPKIDKDLARKKLDIPSDKTVILFFGTIRHSKGLDILIKAFHKAYQQNSDLYLLCAGAFHSVDKDYYKEIVKENLSSENSRVDFGYIDEEMIKYYFCAADILCVPYREIFQSGIAQFGLIYDLPMISSDIRGLSDMIINNKNGLIFKNESIEDLENKIVQLSTDPIMMENFKMESKRLGETKFSVKNRAEKTLEAYNAILF